jgi:hypothetical protein
MFCLMSNILSNACHVLSKASLHGGGVPVACSKLLDTQDHWAECNSFLC